MLSLFFSFFFFRMLERAFFLLLLRFVCPDKGKKHVVFHRVACAFFFFLCDRLLEKTCLCSTTCRRSLKRKTCYCFPLPFFFPRFASRCFKGITPSSVRHMRRRCSCSRWCQQTFFSCYYLFFSELFVFYYYYFFLFRHVSRHAQCLAHMHRSSTQASMFDIFLCRRRTSIV